MSTVTLVAIAVVEQDGKFLVGRRAKHIPQGGLWEFPGGKMQERESPDRAAERECLEETGLEVVATQCLMVNLQQYDYAEVKLHFYACRLKHPPSRGEEAAPRPPYFWVSRQQLGELEFPVGNRPLLEELLG